MDPELKWLALTMGQQVYCRELILAIFIFPSQNNNNVQGVLGVLQSCENVGNF
jgi:hypothetical protein